MVLVPIVVGIFIWQRLPDRRFGQLLVLGGFFNVLAALSGSGDELLYSAGRVATWLGEVVLFYLLLSYPSGHLRHPVDRWLFGAILALVLALFVPTALVSDAYPVPSAWTTCTAGCPSNAFDMLGHEPAWVGEVVVPLREWLASLLAVGVLVRLLHRMTRATTPVRRSLGPVLAGALVHAVALPVAFAVRRAEAPSDVVLTVTWVLAAGLPVLAVGFLLGALRARFAIGNALYRMAWQLQRGRDPQAVRGLLAETLEDPRLELVLRGENGRWLNPAGRAVTLPPPAARRRRTMIRDGDVAVAAIVHDERLAEQRAFVEAAGAFAIMALANERLAAQVEASLQEVRESRERIVAAADDERRRIERDLHDGAQQRLVALQMKLALASERSREQRLPDAAALEEIADDVGDALDDVRSLAAGVYPALLADCGLDDALRAAARRSPVPVSVRAHAVGRQSQDVEAAIYFSCLEALQNAAKHARAASVAIVVTDGAMLRFEVRDDGRGFDPHRTNGGRGLANIRDRVAAVGGSVLVESRAGEGTRIAGAIPHLNEP